MATVAGIIYLNGCNYQLQYDILSQSQANNTTTVRFYGVLNVTAGWVNWDTSKRAWVHYAESRSFGNYFTTGSYTLVQGDFTFTHDANGNKTQNVGFGIDTSFVSESSAVDITFPHIDRFATLSSAQDFTDEGNPKITFTKNVASGSTVYAGIFNSVGTTAYASYRNITSSVSSGEYTFNLTTAERNALRNATPNSKTMQVQFKLYTTISGTNFDGGSITKTMSITNANPTLTSPTYSEQNAKVSALLGSSGSTVVQNASTLRLGITATALKSASISKVVATHSGSNYTDTSSPYSFDIPIKSNSITLTATDSRTNTGTLNITKTMLAYTPVAINTFSFKRQTETSSTIILNLSATYYQQTFGSTANVPIVKWKKDDGSWTTLTSSQYSIDNTNHKLTVSNLSLGAILDYQSEATFTIYIEDKLTIDKNSARVIVGQPTLEMGKDDVKVNGTFEATGNTTVGGTLKVGSFARNTTDTWMPVIRSGILDYTKRNIWTTKTHTNHGTDNDFIPTMSVLSFWNGAYNSSNTSNLTYAHQGTIQCKPVQLYNNSSGTTGTVTLSETASNFQYIEIYFGKQDKYGYNSVKVYTGIDMSKVALFTGYRNQGIHQLQYPTVKINGTSITKNDTGGCNLPSTVFTGNEIYIYRVVGYR